MNDTAHNDARRAVTVRPALASDRGFVLATAERLGAFEPPSFRTREQIVAADAVKLAAWFTPLRRLRRGLARAMGRAPGCALLIAASGDERLGFAYVCGAQDYFTRRREAHLDVIAVTAAAAGRGVGGALLRAAEDWGRARGYRSIALNVFGANRNARAVYERLGYRVETVHYVKDLSPAAAGAHEPQRPSAAAGERPREWFDDDAFWRELYPVIFTERRFEEAGSEVERLLALVGPPAGSAVLDLACGPGRCSIELARRGYRVTGVDRTEFLLHEARERALAAGVAVDWVRADMRDFARPGAFSLVLNLFTSFGYFEDPDEDLLVLRRMLDSLQPGGRCVIDVVSKECLARVYQPITSERLPDGTLVEKHHEVRSDWTRLHEEWVVRRGAGARSFRYDHALYSGRELRERMERAGFADVRLFGSFDGEPYGPDAVCLLAVGRRAA